MHRSWLRTLPACLAALVAASACATAAAVPTPVSGTIDLAESDTVFDLPGTAGDFTRVKFVGDVNGDGIPDQAIAAPFTGSAQRPGAGVVRVVFGRRGYPRHVDLEDLASQSLVILGPNVGAAAGRSVTGVGDVNGDGLGDVAIGAPRAAVAGRGISDGTVSIVFGATTGGTVDLSAPGPRAAVFLGGGQGDLAGSALAQVPDLDGDGRPELVVGAPQVDSSAGGYSGAAYVIAASRLASGGDLKGPQPGIARYIGDKGMALAGYSVAGTPDITGDGIPDVVIGAPGDDAAWVAPGEPGLPQGDHALKAMGIPLRGPSRSLAGESVASVNDVNGDGKPDIAVGASREAPVERKDAGAVHVVYGGSLRAPAALPVDDTTGYRIAGAAVRDRLGSSVAGAGDLDGDGHADIVAGAYGAEPLQRENSGAAYVTFGGPVDLSLAGNRAVRLTGPSERYAGWSVAGGTDVDGDGRPDLLLGEDGQAALVLMPAPAGAPPPGAPWRIGCTQPAGDLELIVGDSQSLYAADPQAQRRWALQRFLARARSWPLAVGAIRFSSRPSQIFPPTVLGTPAFAQDAGMFASLLDEHLGYFRGDHPLTAALAAAATHNPGRDVQIVITDAADDTGAGPSTRGLDVPTFVIGLGVRPDSADAKRLERIATQSDGRFYANVSGAGIEGVLDQIEGALACETPVPLVGTGPDGTVSLPAGADVRVSTGRLVPPSRRRPRLIDLTLMTTWDDPDTPVSVTAVDVLRHGHIQRHIPNDVLLRSLRLRRPVAFGGLRVEMRRGATFVSVRLQGLRTARAALRQADSSSLDTDTVAETLHGEKPKHGKKKPAEVKPRASGRWGPN